LTAASTAGRSPAFRAISAAELLFGAFFVVGHNVFRAVPNEVLILAAAALRILLGDLVIDPATAQFWPPAAEPAAADEITGNLEIAILALVWSFAAFGEEIAYRGYLLTRAADVGGGTPAAYLAGVVIVSVLFGYGHYCKGPAGVVDSAIAG
jgi:membrane protease YdiL (CAAX protease family)